MKTKDSCRAPPPPVYFFTSLLILVSAASNGKTVDLKTSPRRRYEIIRIGAMDYPGSPDPTTPSRPDRHNFEQHTTSVHRIPENQVEISENVSRKKYPLNVVSTYFTNVSKEGYYSLSEADVKEIFSMRSLLNVSSNTDMQRFDLMRLLGSTRDPGTGNPPIAFFSLLSHTYGTESVSTPTSTHHFLLFELPPHDKATRTSKNNSEAMIYPNYRFSSYQLPAFSSILPGQTVHTNGDAVHTKENDESLVWSNTNWQNITGTGSEGPAQVFQLTASLPVDKTTSSTTEVFVKETGSIPWLAVLTPILGTVGGLILLLIAALICCKCCCLPLLRSIWRRNAGQCASRSRSSYTTVC